MTNLELLRQLQSINDQEKELDRNINDESVSEDISRLEKEVNKAKAKLEAKEEQLKNLKREIKDKEFEEARLIRKEEDYKEQLYSGSTSNPKELEKLQEKLSKTESSKEELEDILLEEMVLLEEIIEEMESLTEEVEEKEADLNKLNSGISSKREEMEKKLKGLSQKKEELKDKLDESLISEYNKLDDSKYGKVVVELKEGYCMGCRMSLPVNLIKKVKRDDEIVKCENCGRILYWVE